MNNSRFIGAWEKVRPLGAGGQGEVWLARSEAAANKRQALTAALTRTLRGLNRGGQSDEQQSVETLQAVQLISDLGSDEPLEGLGAAKLFNSAVRSNEQARRRLEKEVAVLSALDHPSVIRLLDSDVPSMILVTEYHSGGTLSDQLPRFKGDVLSSLKALRGLVEGIAEIHKLGAVHRDVKPHNILIAADGRFVLADFGIVFFADTDKTRITDLIGERVGPTDWMAPWANVAARIPIEELHPTFDLYPIGKLLWCMVSGRVLPFWRWQKGNNNLEMLFPGQPEMAVANEVIAKVVVEEEKDCCSDAAVLLDSIDNAITRLERGGTVLRSLGGWPCRICGVGTYEPSFVDEPGGSIQFWRLAHSETRLLQVQPFNCAHCGHTELFQLRNRTLAANAWES